MRILRTIVIWVVALVVGVIVSYNLVYPTYRYRYRMTVDVMVDGVVHSGSSVIEVQLEKQPLAQLGPPVLPKAIGEAVFVDLGGGRNVIALLAADNLRNVDYPEYLVGRHSNWSGAENSDLARFTEATGSWELPRDQMPTFATFVNLADPATARSVLPDDFENVFGPEVHFKRVLIQMVPAGFRPFGLLGVGLTLGGEPMTSGIEKKIPWWNEPLPWMKRIGISGDVYGDFRPMNSFRWNKSHLKRNY
jgi:hypothetical protein